MAINETFGWIWVLGGMLSGLALGLRFHEDAWLGGYASLPRRMVRLGHISFLGLGFTNILFALSAPRIHLPPGLLLLAARALLLGGITMPVSCALMAWRRGMIPVFAVPVVSLAGGAALVVAGFLRP